MALRLDGDVLRVLIPACPGEVVTGATVTDRASTTSVLPSWSASRLTGDVRQGIRLSAQDWEHVEGSYADRRAIDVSIQTDVWSYGTVVEPPASLDDLRLAEGEFFVDGEALTATEYADRVDPRETCPD